MELLYETIRIENELKHKILISSQQQNNKKKKLKRQLSKEILKKHSKYTYDTFPFVKNKYLVDVRYNNDIFIKLSLFLLYYKCL